MLNTEATFTVHNFDICLTSWWNRRCCFERRLAVGRVGHVVWGLSAVVVEGGVFGSGHMRFMQTHPFTLDQFDQFLSLKWLQTWA